MSEIEVLRSLVNYRMISVQCRELDSIAGRVNMK